MENFLTEILRLEKGDTIKSTLHYITQELIVKSPVDYREFKPSIAFKSIVIFLFTGFLVVIIFKVSQQKKLTTNEIRGAIAGGICFFILGINIIRQFFTSKAMNFTIRVDYSGIWINDTQNSWNDICETAIMTKAGGRRIFKFLVIVTSDNPTYQVYDLTNFSSLNRDGFVITLAKYIEYFKPTRK